MIWAKEMEQIRQQTLLQKFPLLYYRFYFSAMETCMCWGFACGDGWYELLYELSEELEQNLNRKWHERLFGLQLAKLSRLWNKLLVKLRLDNSNLFWYYEMFTAEQVKEKFGTLCFYTSHHDDKLQEIISRYTQRSAVTCEKCGSSGTLVGGQGQWWHVTCTGCASERDLEFIRTNRDTMADTL